MTPAKYLSDIMGCCVHWSAPDLTSWPKLKALGVKWLRRDITWQNTETAPGVFNWTNWDTLATHAKQEGYTLLWILDYGNTLYTASDKHPPTTPEALTAWQEFCRQVAARYKDFPCMFEIWNEPDQPGFWKPTPNIANLATVIDRAVLGIRAGNHAATIISPGFSRPSAGVYSYLETLTKGGQLAKCNALGMHFYPFSDYHAPEFNLSHMLRCEAIADATASLNVVCTEWGYSSYSTVAGSNGTSVEGRERQAKYDIRMLLAAWIGGLPFIMLYDDRDDGTTATDKEHNFGLYDLTYVSKPAYNAVLALTQFFNGAAYHAHEVYGNNENGSAKVVALGTDGKQRIAAWAWGSSSIVVRIPDANAQTVVDKFGVAFTTFRQIGTVKEYTVTDLNGPLYIT